MDFEANLRSYSKLNTVSIAFPESIFDNVPTPQLESYLIGQLARAAVIYRVSEIIIFSENKNPNTVPRMNRLVKLFEYAECPQYLRKILFHIEPDLKFAGMINPLESQHHLRTSQIECPYREGVAVRHVTANGQEKTEINIGLNAPVAVEEKININTRVTVKLDPADLKKMSAMLAHSMSPPKAEVVMCSEPTSKLNLYWGYFVRPADSLSEVLNKNIFDPNDKKFYDLIIGTSERGICVDEVEFGTSKKSKKDADNIDHEDNIPVKKKKKRSTSHTLIVFGGVKGLEHSLENDESLKTCKDVSSLFHHYINTCPNQGSNTIRTEEAILITMASLRPKLNL